MPYIVDFENVSEIGLEFSPVASALAGLRANEARYFHNKYQHAFTTLPAAETRDVVAYVSKILKDERDIEIAATPLETSQFRTEDIEWSYVFYENGLAVNVLYGIESNQKRAVGFKLSDGMPIPDELATKFKFAKQKSRLAGTIRGSFFVIKGAY